jgi:DNA-binding transcriptional ArsR family regulator
MAPDLITNYMTEQPKLAYRSSSIYDNNMTRDVSIEHFEPLARACKALAHPARLAILQTLARRGTCICGEIVDVMPLSQATVSQHLKILKEADLIIGETDGPRSCYCINSKALGAFREQFENLFGALENCC